MGDYPVPDVLALRLPEVRDCNQKCLEIKTCVSWSWKISVDVNNCYLKGTLPDATAKTTAVGVISGSPQPSRSTMRPVGQLYCFTVVMPLGDEKNLLKFQFDKGTGIFACDMYSLYSSVEMEVVTGIFAVVLKQDLVCQPGPSFHTCLFTGMLQMIWSKVVSEEQYLQYQWTVKVKPDVVFLPDRLRQALSAYDGDSARPSFINNCKFGMHGPLQVLSRGAVAIYSIQGTRCSDDSQELSLDTVDEGQLMEFCLRTVLKFEKINNYRLLADEHCGIADWQSCSSDSIAFEPFKTTDTFKECLSKTSRPSEITS